MDGVLNIYKPSGISSFDVVRKIMKLCNTRKVGHTGTLDPLASGVLPICVGKATKIVDYLMSETKTYRAQLKLGITTDTYDREGSIISEKKVNISEEAILRIFNQYIGEIEQEPPMYSALKVNGKRLYELARQGIVIERNKRNITIFDITIEDISLPIITFIVTCSKGTYIRSLCHDIGNNLGTGGIMWNLERTQTGNFKKENSIDFYSLDEEIISKNILQIEHSLNIFDKVSFSNKYEKLLLNGVKIKNTFIINSIDMDKILRVYVDTNKFIGLGKRDEEGFKIIKLLV
ncbi:tRNA pseudouridine(55) synthase TruB [Clostridium sp. YIM B02515]|uniref:tRNA pseudouridine synthase B n=1 Tax=Clostridium rhizosphaerae TaxID=2803861 RepID=A0ABS1T6C7_9CLOT|nr:tRNA pseudouridine(55) synthase TruB [Clostridium rhizosphaerae]MBL4934890.1 tRNA pseudouridine(55) synthase TruB [Clostridium rhizosphaerae]